MNKKHGLKKRLKAYYPYLSIGSFRGVTRCLVPDRRCSELARECAEIELAADLGCFSYHWSGSHPTASGRQIELAIKPIEKSYHFESATHELEITSSKLIGGINGGLGSRSLLYAAHIDLNKIYAEKADYIAEWLACSLVIGFLQKKDPEAYSGSLSRPLESESSFWQLCARASLESIQNKMPGIDIKNRRNFIAPLI